MMSVWDEMNGVVDRYDSEFKVDVGTATCWAGFLRVTLTNPDAGASRSMTFFKGGFDSPEEVARCVLDDFAAWHEETGIEPMPMPEWMKR
jgi:hypothetical protein